MIITSHMQKIIQTIHVSQNWPIFQPKTKISPQNPCFKYFMIEPIQDNDHHKPHAKNYSNLSMFTKVIA